jgi:ATP-binding protein involved in chromosome partitioning
MSVSREAVLEALRAVPDPVGGGDLAGSGMVRALAVEEGTVRFVIEVAPERAAAMEPVRAEAEARVRALPGVRSVSAVMTAHAAKAAPELKARPKKEGPKRVPGVARVVAVASGKGGVGKSTVSANLACALALEGRRVGLLDADVYGPSQPRMMGVSGRPASPDGKIIEPKRAHGVTVMSMGLMLEEGQAVVWRGPMLMSALQQMMLQVAWGELDVLVVDLPPGTGDVQMTLAQRFEVEGAVIVSTPQDVALIDARKAIDAFAKLGVPILGLVENMSTHICSRCGHEEPIFGHGGVAREAEAMGAPLLAEIPLHIDVRTASDAGVPLVAAEPDSPRSAAFRSLARALVAAGHG